MNRLALRGGAPVRADPLPSWPPLSSEAAARLAELARHGPWSTWHGGARAAGPQKEALEKAFAGLCGTRFALGVATGTTALDLAIEALGLPPGGSVIAAAYGHPATVNAAARAHQLWLLDVTPGTLCLAPDELADALSGPWRHEVRCVITTHFAGQPGGILRIRELCGAAGVPLIEDASHAHGARVAGRMAGSFGAMGCFSLHTTKVVAAGEGGIVTTDSEPLWRALWRLHDLGRDPGAGPFDFAGLGGNHRISELHAYLARVELETLPVLAARRASAMAQLREALRGGPLELLALEPEVEVHAYHLVVARYAPERCGGLSRKRFQLALAAEGIPCHAGWPATLPRLPGLRDRCLPHPVPVAERVLSETLWLDARLLLADEGVEQAAAAVSKIQALAHTLRSGA